VQGSGAVLRDPRLVTLVREALSYARDEGLRLWVDNDLLTVRVGDFVYSAIKGASPESDRLVTLGCSLSSKPKEGARCPHGRPSCGVTTRFSERGRDSASPRRPQRMPYSAPT
jgi:hypothetical protein